MKTTIKVPDVGTGDEQIILCSWEAAPGDVVSEGAPLYVIEANKATDEICADCDMRIVSLLAEEGDPVRPGDVIAEAETF